MEDNLRRSNSPPESGREITFYPNIVKNMPMWPRLLDEILNLCKMLRSKGANKWEAAMQEEYNLLKAKSTWELSDLPKDYKIIECKWMVRTKNNAFGEIVRYKMWLVARGYFQVVGVDYNVTFIPVAKSITIRCTFTLRTTIDWKIHQMDVKVAFLMEY